MMQQRHRAALLPEMPITGILPLPQLRTVRAILDTYSRAAFEELSSVDYTGRRTHRIFALATAKFSFLPRHFSTSAREQTLQ